MISNHRVNYNKISYDRQIKSIKATLKNPQKKCWLQKFYNVTFKIDRYRYIC